jgi:ATP-dependent RNA circularization protein (DNA/RNA ligase family)
MNNFFRFPHTPHLVWLGKGEPRDDKVLTRREAEKFLSLPLVLEEKVDGANLGFSLSADGELRVQNRGQYLPRPFTGQFARLNAWLALHEEALFDALGSELILFGEWVAAVHSLDYQRLPDCFLVFDVYDRDSETFWCTRRRNQWVHRLGLQTIRCIAEGNYRLDALETLLQTAHSAYRDGFCEGLYLRQEDDNRLIARAKLVHPDFTQSIGRHWRKKTLKWNHLSIETASDNADTGKSA